MVRPNVMAIVHSHSPALIPFADVAVPDAPDDAQCRVHGRRRARVRHPRYGGLATNLLVSNAVLGQALAAVLGPHNLALMRGHGMVASGQSVRHATFRAVYAEVNAREQADSLRLGQPTYLFDEEARAAATTNDGLVDRPWELGKLHASRGGQ